MSVSTPDQAHDQLSELSRRIAELESDNARLRGNQQRGADPDEQERPWNVARENAEEQHTRDVAPLPYRGPGAVTHHFPHLTGGSGGPQDGPWVRAVVELLAELGYDTNGVIRGEINHFDNTVMGDIRRFQNDHNVREQTTAYNGHNHPAEEVSRNLVGPYTIQALFDKTAEKLGQSVEGLIGRVEYQVARAQNRF